MIDRNTYAEQYGMELGHRLIDLLLGLKNKPQSENFEAVAEALCVLTLLKDEYMQNAADGFAGALVDVLMVGIENLPKEGA